MSDASQNGNGYSRTNLYISMMGGAFAIFVTVVSAIFWISGIAQSVQNTSKSLEDATLRVGNLESTVGSNGIKITTLQRNQNEIETQFCANDIVRNLMHANDLREVSILWQKVFSNPYPLGNAYYPMICNRNVPQ